MKKLFSAVLFSILFATSLQAVSGPFVYKQLVTSAEMNWAFANADIKSGTIDGATIGAITPNTGNFTVLSINGAPLDSLYAPISYSQFSTLSANTTLTSADTKGQTYTLFSASAITVLLPTGSAGDEVTFQNITAFTDVVTATGGNYLIYPDSTATQNGSVNIPPNSSITLSFDSNNNWFFRSQTGNPIIANATASNQALPLGQANGLYSPISFSEYGGLLSTNVTLADSQVLGQRYGVYPGVIVTLPNPVSGNERVTLWNNSGSTFQVNANSILLPDGSTATSIIPSTNSAYASITLQAYAGASNVWLVVGQTGQTIISPATASNQAVALGQLTGTASLTPNFTGMNLAGVTNPALFFSPSSGATQTAQLTQSGDIFYLDAYGVKNLVSTDLVTGATTFVATVQSTNIVTGQTVPITAPVSGTVYQNTNAFQIEIYEPVTYNATGAAAATDEFLMGSTNTPAAVFTNSEPATSLAGIVQTDHVTIPPGWYYEWTVANATLGTTKAFAGLR